MSRVLTGDRPTGALHLGHYFGTLANRVRLQREGHELFVVVADYQVITDRDDPGPLRETVRELVRDYLAVGLDPETTVVFPHSAIPALNQLLLPFLSLVGMGELTRNPTVKDEIRYAGRDTVSGLMFTYPVHQAADILFCHGELVPVGKDQLPHLELTRSIARRFNERYAPLFPLPDALLGEAPVLRGLDGRKMSKSLGNAIALSDDRDTIAAKIRAARTDSDRHIGYDPQRRPDVANLLTIAALCTGREPGRTRGRDRRRRRGAAQGRHHRRGGRAARADPRAPRPGERRGHRPRSQARHHHRDADRRDDPRRGAARDGNGCRRPLGTGDSSV